MNKILPETELAFIQKMFVTNESPDLLKESFADFIPALLYIYDPRNEKIKFINKKATEILGYTAEEIMGWNNDLWSMVFEEDWGIVRAELLNFTKLNDGSSRFYYCRYNHKTSKWRHFLTQGMILERDEKGLPSSLLFVAQDMTDEIEHEKTFKDLSEYKQAMLDKEKFLSSGSWEKDLKSNKHTWSEGKYRLFGYETEDIQSMPVITQDLYSRHLSPAELARVKGIWDYIENECEHEFTWDYELRTVQGERKVLESYARILRDEQGNKYKIIGASRDITKMREYEESLKKKIDELDRSNKELEEFAYIASHDLQEPLRKITAFSERLKEKASRELSEESNVYLDRVLASTANMRSLIDNLLEFSRTSRHNQPFEMTDLNLVFEQVKAELELKIEETGAIIEARPLPVIEGIPSQMQQLFTNLFSNAIKFRKENQPPRISVKAELLSTEEKQQYHLEPENSYYKIFIKDDGIGFEPEYANKIFQIFQRLHGKAEYPGSGIGLAICKKIAENHHGLIRAESVPGEGATFITILPETQP